MNHLYRFDTINEGRKAIVFNITNETEDTIHAESANISVDLKKNEISMDGALRDNIVLVYRIADDTKDLIYIYDLDHNLVAKYLYLGTVQDTVIVLMDDGTTHFIKAKEFAQFYSPIYEKLVYWKAAIL